MHALRRLAVLTAALCALAAHAGAKVTTEIKRKGQTSTLTLQVEGKNARMEVTKEGSPEPEGTFISDGDGKRVLIVEHEKKQYAEITQEQMKQVKAKMEAAMAQMKAQLAKLPPEQRAKVEAMMAEKMKGPAAAPEEKYVRASGGKKIAGYACDLHRVEVEGKHVADTCLIPWASLKVDREQFRQSLEAMQEIWSVGPGPRPAAPGLKAWGLAAGLPAWRRSLADDEGDVTETTLVSITQGAVPKEAFAPPAGYARKSLGEKLEQMERKEK